MRRLMTAVSMICTLVLACAGSGPDATKLVDTALDSSVSVWACLDSAATLCFPVGSGVVVDLPGIWTGSGVVTARHVANFVIEAPSSKACSLTNPDVCFQLPNAFIGEEGLSDTNDWALYEVRHVPLIIGEAKLATTVQVGEEVIVVGIPEGEPQVTSGVISWVTESGLITSDARVLPGSSGGPVFNQRGELVGIVVALRISSSFGLPVETWSYIVPISVVRGIS